MRKSLFAVVSIGAVATVLGGALATAAFASSGVQAKPTAAAPAPAQVTAQHQPVAQKAVTRAESGMSPENEQLLQIQKQIKATVYGPTAA